MNNPLIDILECLAEQGKPASSAELAELAALPAFLKLRAALMALSLEKREPSTVGIGKILRPLIGTQVGGLRLACVPGTTGLRRWRAEAVHEEQPPDARPTPVIPAPWTKPAESEPAPMPPSPLETARLAQEEAKTKRDLRGEHKAQGERIVELEGLLGEALKLKAPPDIVIYQRAAPDRSDAIACAVASDWHVEEPVERASVHGLNEFNLEIAKSRAEHFFKNTLRLTDIMGRETKINTLYLAILGDFFSGFIHDELIANNLLAPGDAAQFCKSLWVSGIDFLLRESSYTLVADMVPGNHGRMTKQVWHGDPTGTSLESFMYSAIADRYHAEPRVRFNVSPHAMVYRRFHERFNMRLIHGYEVKYGGGVGGLTIPLRKALAQWNNPIRADLTVLGHFHQFFDGGDFIVNGSLIGYNTFAQAIKASYEEARQAFFCVHARAGGQKSVTAPIWLDDAHRQEAPAALLETAP